MVQPIRYRFSRRLKELRREYGFTQQELAEKADLDYKHIQRIESKRPTDVKLETLGRLAKAFGMPLYKLLKF